MAKHIKDLVDQLLPQHKDWKFQLLSNWNNIIGDLHKQVRLEKIHEDSLVLGVTNSSWMQELYLLSPLLIKKINEKLDVPRIKQLRFKIASIQKQKNKIALMPKKLKQVVLSGTEKEALEKIVDEQLRDAMKNFLIRCYHEQQ